MDKLEIQKLVSINERIIDLDDFTWNNSLRLFTCELDNLNINFKGINDVTFIINSDCKLECGDRCQIISNNKCRLYTGNTCKFTTKSNCKFKTGEGCIFDTGSRCDFNTGESCTFDTGVSCNFVTLNNSTFTVGCDCSFTVGCDCVIIRYEEFEVIRPVDGITILLHEDIGYHEIEKPEQNWFIKN